MFRFGENVFLEWNEDGRTVGMTYDACRVCVEAAAGAFSDTLSGVPHGAFVGLQKENSPEWVVAFWALLMAGYRPLLLPKTLDAAGTRALLGQAGAAALAADAPLDGFLFVDMRNLLQTPFVLPAFSPVWADGVAVCTSGTSGEPKLCIYDGRAISAQIQNSRYVMQQNSTIETYWNGRVCQLAFLPFCHIFGLSACLLWFSFFGSTFVFLKSYAPRAIQDACRRHGVTHVFGVPLLFRTVAQSVWRQAEQEGQTKRLTRALAVSIRLQTALPRLGAWLVRRVLLARVRERVLGPSVRFCITGGGCISYDTLQTLNGLGYALYNGYGATETGICSVELRLPARDRLAGTVGKPFPSLAYRLSRAGELEVRGDTLYTAMLRDGAQTPRGDGWHPTGDLARIGADGRCTVLGRLDDLIVTEGGVNLAPDALEEVFFVEHVRQVCVVGVPDAAARVAVTLVAELEAGLPTFAEKLTLTRLDAVNRALPAGSRASRILIADEPLPLAMECKVCRGRVRAGLLDGTLRVHEAAPAGGRPAVCDGDEILSGVLEIFCEVFLREAGGVLPESHLIYDLGCDSLTYFALVNRIGETYRTPFPITGEQPPMTPAAFAAAIAKQNGMGGERV